MTDRLINYIRDEILQGDIDLELDAESNLLEDGLVDSLGVMRIIAFIEEEKGLRIPPQDLTIENFMTVTAISEYLATLEN